MSNLLTYIYKKCTLLYNSFKKIEIMWCLFVIPNRDNNNNNNNNNNNKNNNNGVFERCL